MPARLVICPVDVEVGEDGIIRRTPRVGNIADPGKPPFIDPDPIVDGGEGPRLITPKCVFNAAISGGQLGQENDFCFCVVVAIDLSAVDDDPEVETLFEVSDDQPLDGLHAWLVKTPKVLGWKAGKINKIKGKLNKRGVANADLTKDDPLWEYANRIARKYSTTPGWDIRRAKTTRAGA